MNEVNYKNSKLIVESGSLQPGTVSWQSPSNIAIVKYWGKHGVQLPRNPSFSFTLSEAHSRTSIRYEAKKTLSHEVSLQFLFHGQAQASFEEKIKKYFSSLLPYFPFIRQLHFTISSENSFPHSAGIASSASGMSALALCLCSIEEKMFGTVKERPDFEKKASYMARLGSGSACRSIFSQGAIWGQHMDVEEGSDLYAIPFNTALHELFQDVQDTILLISRSEKSVSSRAGHQLMENNIYADNRYKQANQRLQQLLPALRTGDWDTFGAITESEAMTLHALMMTSMPPYILMEPNTLEAINRIRSFRDHHKLPVYFTLDAGPNIHLLYPKNIKPQIDRFINDSLKGLCSDGQFIHDHAGIGPVEF